MGRLGMSPRTWQTLWIDPRRFPQCLVALSLCALLASWIVVSIAVGQTLPTDGGATVAKEELIRFQWWAISGLLGIVGVLASFIIVRQMNNQRSELRDLWDKKLGKEEHKHMDHSRLCPRCRHEVRE